MSTQPPPSEAPPTAAGFLRGVLRSGLLSHDHLQAAVCAAPPEQREDARALAEHLVRTGKLTRFQAGKLLRGVHHGMIIGPFRILAPVGKGGMGTVFLVRDSRHDLLAALKILPPKLARTQERMLERFRREKEISQRVAHPHLAWTYEVGEYRGVHYIAMEYIPGHTLARLVMNEGPLEAARAARLMAEAAAALHHAHTQGLVHRDLKPSNIMVTPHDHAKVLDLGLALVQGEIVTDNAVVGGQGYIVGTMDYISPEQTYDALKVDGRSDLYSLGCTLYYALTGQPPFPGGTTREKVLRHRSETPPPLAKLAPTAPPGFILLVERLMAKDPADRPATAEAAAAELRAWAAGEVEQPLDRQDEVTFDEALLRQAPDAVEYSLVSLPKVEVLDEADAPLPEMRPGPPAWLMPALAVGLAVVVAIGMLAILIVWLTHS